MRFLRTWSLPLLSLLSLMSPSTISAAVFGEAGVSNPQMTWTGGAVRCTNGIVRYEWLISQTDSSMNGAAHQPMAESGLPTVVLSFNANILKVAQSAPSQATTTISGNKLTQNVVDDGPNVVQELTFQGIDCNNFQNVIYSMTATAPATGTTTPLLAFPIKATKGFSATPVTVGTAGNANNNNGGAVTPVATQAPATVTTQAPAQTPATNGNMNIIKFTGGFGNCFTSNGAGASILQFQIAESNDGGKTFSQPMAEKGLPTVTFTFSNAVTSTGTTFNVANSAVTGKTWTFTVQDDQPNVGAGLAFTGITCDPKTGAFLATPTYSITASVGGQQFAVIGATANNNNGGAMTPVVTPPAPAVPPATAINKNTFGTAMVKNVVQKFTVSGNNNCWLQNGQTKAVLQFAIAQTDSGSPNAAHAPMSETGLPDVTITFAAPVTVSGTFNVANPTSTGNSFKFTELNDQPVVGGQFTFGTGVTCTAGNLANAGGAMFTFSIAAKVGNLVMPTTSNSPGFKALGAENLLDDGSATVDMTTTDNNTGTTIPIAVIAGAIAGGVVLLIIASLLVIRYRRNKQQQTSPSNPSKVAWYVEKETRVTNDNKV